MSVPVKADIELFMSGDRDVTVPLTVDGAPDPVATLGKELRVLDVFGDPILTKTGTVSPLNAATCLFSFAAGDFGAGTSQLRVGQYNYGVWITETGRTYLATYGRLTISASPR